MVLDSQSIIKEVFFILVQWLEHGLTLDLKLIIADYERMKGNALADYGLNLNKTDFCLYIIGTRIAFYVIVTSGA